MPDKPLLVAQTGEASRLLILQIDGGRDAKYVFVAAKKPPRPDRPRTVSDASFRETIGYRPEVAGTDLIYDLSAEAMQGKARPFISESQGEPKVYAILPVQLEAIDVRVEVSELFAPKKVLCVEFHDARGERLQAVLPFHLRVEGPDGKPLVQRYDATNREGQFISAPKLLEGAPTGSRIVIRSQLTGWEKSVRIVP